MDEGNRSRALSLLKEHVTTESLLKHAYAVEAAMRRMARHFHQDEELWGVAGLLHDLDYQEYPEEHCRHVEAMLRDAGYGDEIVRAILSHGYGLCTDVEPKTEMEKSLYAVDELTGLITAVVLMRPSKSILDLTVKSVKKKWKAKTFAAGCNREVIQDGADRLEMPWETLVQLVIEGMQTQAKELGLEGTLGGQNA
ncbi:MAG: HD domain-containing protein [Acutalibacteraceae bacterium]